MPYSKILTLLKNGGRFRIRGFSLTAFLSEIHQYIFQITKSTNVKIPNKFSIGDIITYLTYMKTRGLLR